MQIKTLSLCAVVLFAAFLSRSHSGGRAGAEEKGAQTPNDDITAGASWRKSVGIIDLHGHIQADAIEKTLHAMDASSIARMVNLTPARNAAEFEAAKRLFDDKGKGRFILYVNDVYNNFPVEDPDFGKKVAAVIDDCVRLGARGLKVSKTLGLYWKDKDGKIIPIDDPRLEPMWEACARLKIPVSIHSGDPKAFWLPIDEKNERYDELKLHPEWGFGGGKYPPREEVLRQLFNVVARHQAVTFVGVHFGNNPEDIDSIRDALSRYPNYNVDLAARLGEIGRHDPRKLRKLFIDFQDRILFGTDFMVSNAGFILGAGPRLTGEAEVRRFYDAHWRFLETDAQNIDHPTPIQGHWKVNAIGLPREVLEKVYRKNAERIVLKAL